MSKRIELALTIRGLLALLVLCFPALGFPETKILYYEKTADSGKVAAAVRDFARQGGSGFLPVIVPANPYYEERGLPTNAVMCGSEASPQEVRALVELLISQGVQVQYVGQYRNPEINSGRDTIDIRSIGDDVYFKNHWPINPDAVDWTKLQCGFGESAIRGERRDYRNR
jgi:hypothetical protein